MKKIFTLVVLTAVLAPAIAFSQTYETRKNEGMLPDRLPSSATLQMFRFGGTRVGEEVYVTGTPSFESYSVPAAALIDVKKGGEIKVEIKRNDKAPVYLDTVELVAGNKRYRPTKAMADGKDVTKKLAMKDEDCASFKDLVLEFPPIGDVDLKTVTLDFTASAGHVSKTIAMPAQKDGPTIVQSSKYFNYLPGSKKGSVVLDNVFMTEAELGRPNYTQKVSLAIGEGRESIKMWVRDDGSNLSVALDVAADNTLDEASDKTILYVRGRDGLASFTAGAGGDEYGRMGAAYTGESKAEHRVYEFVIPFSLLPAVDDKGKWGIAFAVTM